MVFRKHCCSKGQPTQETVLSWRQWCSMRKWCLGDYCAPRDVGAPGDYDAVESWRLLVRDGAVWETGVLKERWCPGDSVVRETVMVQQMLQPTGQEMVVSRSQCAQETGALGVCPSVRRV